jgi:hypothetical protein
MKWSVHDFPCLIFGAKTSENSRTKFTLTFLKLDCFRVMEKVFVRKLNVLVCKQVCNFFATILGGNLIKKFCSKFTRAFGMLDCLKIVENFVIDNLKSCIDRK